MSQNMHYQQFPATAGQAAIYYAEQKQPPGCSYNAAMVADIRGSIDRDKLIGACRGLAKATPSMRLRFGIDSTTGQVVQWFSAEDLEIEWHDAPGAPATRVAELIDQNTSRPFESDEGPLTRFVVITTGNRQAWVAIVSHHLTLDGVSYLRLARRLCESIGDEVEPDSEHRYIELTDKILDAEREAGVRDRLYWRARLGARTSANYQNNNLSFKSGAAGRRTRLMIINSDHTRQLVEHTAIAKVRMFHLLAGAVHRALPMSSASDSADCGRESIVCVAASVRPPRRAYDDVIGCFINEVPLVTRIADSDTMGSIAVREAPRWAEDLRRRNFPFTELVRDVGSGRWLDRIMLSYRDTPRFLEWGSGDLTCKVSLYPRYLESMTDLSVRFFHHQGWMEYEVQWSGAESHGLHDQFCETLGKVLHDVSVN